MEKTNDRIAFSAGRSSGETKLKPTANGNRCAGQLGGANDRGHAWGTPPRLKGPKMQSSSSMIEGRPVVAFSIDAFRSCP